MDSGTIGVEVLKWGMGGAVLLVIFWKFIPSLFEFLKGRSNEDVSRHLDAIHASKQRSEANERRITRLEADHAELREAMSEVRTVAKVSQAILERIEAKI